MAKTKIYLDTNMIFDLFLSRLQTLRADETAKLPKKFEFFVESRERFEYITSVLVKAEIAREFVSGYHLSKSEIERLWTFVVEQLGMTYLPSFVVDEALLDFACRFPLRLRTLMNFQHVVLSAESGAFFVTGDKDIVAKINDTGIGKAFSYPGFRDFGNANQDASPSSQK